ncbi:DUF202 domain-containing protein [Mucilaginibacter daejeonensis]|uniref:YidH family protein n=1 Tax=Mucilaginibacter daejeonensis TaxID=398049 RepID=UPI001D17B2CB|nr:DUF202 domain-containing protein [Mucilaginibacter daejeonensis]UEG51858.1 DUF202 domain-containing protein [Mucilaginibacter daejeonensis]
MSGADTSKQKINPGDHLANERTFLAWIRTSIALMGFGFVVVKFSLFVKQLSLVITDKVLLPGKGFSATIGIILVAIGALMALLSYFRYRRIEKQLLRNAYFLSFALSLLMTVAIVLVSGLLLWYLLPNT